MLPPLLDAHAHLADPCFDADLPAVLERARAAGVVRIVVVGESLEDDRRALDLAARHPAELLAAAGCDPTHLDRDEADRIVALCRARAAELAAIGEVGLDHWKVVGEADREVQREILSRFVALAIELDLPLNVHSRTAGRDTIALLIERGARRVLLHAFDGRAATAMAGVEAGYFFSIPPSIVRSAQKQKLVRRLPLSCLLLETDSPALGAVPGERNEPASLPIALDAVAEIKGASREEVAEAAAANARRLFGPRAP